MTGQGKTSKNTHNIELSRSNTLENQEIIYGNHAPLNINAQNNTTATPGCVEAQNNTIGTPSRAEPNWTDIGCKLKESLKFRYRHAIYKNSLLLLSYAFLYLDFDDACHKGYSSQIE